MKFYIVNAFSEKIFGGNLAGVVLLPQDCDFPSDEICAKTAAELRYSETAFVRRIGSKEFKIRYFTPVAEVSLCGHATIATFAALRQSGAIGEGDYLLHAPAGRINVSVECSRIFMDMAKPVSLRSILEESELAELYGIMGLHWQEQSETGLSLRPQIISTGLPDILMPVVNEDTLNRINPNFPELSALSVRYGVVGVHAFTVGCENRTFHTRNFAPLYGIDEEAATGTATGALIYYGFLHGLVKIGDSCICMQGERMGRPSTIVANIARKGGDIPEQSSPEILEHPESVEGGEGAIRESVVIRVGGSGAILAEGKINIC